MGGRAYVGAMAAKGAVAANRNISPTNAPQTQIRQPVGTQLTSPSTRNRQMGEMAGNVRRAWEPLVAIVQRNRAASTMTIQEPKSKKSGHRPDLRERHAAIARPEADSRDTPSRTQYTQRGRIKTLTAPKRPQKLIRKPRNSPTALLREGISERRPTTSSMADKPRGSPYRCQLRTYHHPAIIATGANTSRQSPAQRQSGPIVLAVSWRSGGSTRFPAAPRPACRRPSFGRVALIAAPSPRAGASADSSDPRNAGAGTCRNASASPASGISPSALSLDRQARPIRIPISTSSLGDAPRLTTPTSSTRVTDESSVTRLSLFTEELTMRKVGMKAFRAMALTARIGRSGNRYRPRR